MEELKPKFIYVEGNIGSGKTNLLNNLSKKYFSKVHVELEPLDTWLNYKNEFNLLDLMYSDPKTFAFQFQIMAQVTQSLREITTRQILDKQFIFFERSLRTQLIFIEILYKTNKLSKLDYLILTDLYKIIKKPNSNCKIIYLRTDPSVCLERIKVRNRKEESVISLEYLEMLHKKHDEWLLSLNNCVIIDGNLMQNEILNLVVKSLKINDKIYTGFFIAYVGQIAKKKFYWGGNYKLKNDSCIIDCLVYKNLWSIKFLALIRLFKWVFQMQKKEENLLILLLDCQIAKKFYRGL